MVGRLTSGVEISEGAYYSGDRIWGSDDAILGHIDYSYDEFNRLLGSNHTTNGQAFSYSYDRYGNRLSQTATQGGGPQPSFSFDVSSNRLSGFSYDAAGNVLSDGIHSYQTMPKETFSTSMVDRPPQTTTTP
jgi:YD repeat-containing protein